VRGSNDRAKALGPEFNPQYHQEKKERNLKYYCPNLEIRKPRLRGCITDPRSHGWEVAESGFKLRLIYGVF
jgi:hypothetical protein